MYKIKSMRYRAGSTSLRQYRLALCCMPRYLRALFVLLMECFAALFQLQLSFLLRSVVPRNEEDETGTEKTDTSKEKKDGRDRLIIQFPTKQKNEGENGSEKPHPRSYESQSHNDLLACSRKEQQSNNARFAIATQGQAI